MSYQPFLIADFKTGVELDKEPWLLPKDAFTTMENAYLYEGVIIKRLGYTRFGQLQHRDPQDYLADYTKAGADQARITGFTATKITLTDLDDNEEAYAYDDFTAGYFSGDDEFELDFKCTDGGAHAVLWAITQDLGAVVSLAVANKNLIYVWMNASDKLQIASYHVGASDNDVTTAALTINSDYYLRIKLDRTAGTVACSIYSDVNRSTLVETITCDIQDITDDYQYLYGVSSSGNGGGGVTWDGEIRNLSIVTWPGSDVMGLHTFNRATGVAEFLAMNEERLNKYNTTNDRFEDVSLAKMWAGGNDKFFCGTVYNDKYYMTNGVDVLTMWDGSDHTNVTVDIGSGGNDLTSARFCVDYKSRLLLFDTVETFPAGGGTFRQRVRWPNVGTTVYTNDGYVDCPTQDWMVGLGFVGDTLIVIFTDSVWALKYTGDATLPYRWENIVTNRGGAAPFSVVPFPDEIVVLGPTGLITCDGLDVDEVLKKTPDITLDFALDNLKYCYGTYHGETRQLWLSYPKTGSTLADRVLVYNHKEKSISIFTLSSHCFGEYQVDVDLTWDEIEETWDEIEWAWDDPTRAGGYPQVMMGDVSGYVWVLNEGITDGIIAGAAGSLVTMTLIGGRWNPYSDKAQKARLGYIDFLVDRDPAITLTIKLSKDMGGVYATKTVTCSGAGSKVWKRIQVNQVGFAHKIEITHTGAQQPKIHAIMPWFKPAGRIA